MTDLSWSTEQRRINDLLPFDQNPRAMTEEEHAQLKKSLEKFNLAEIPAITPSGKIVAGHQRVRLLKELGRGDEIIDVRVPNRELTSEEFQEYLIRSNKTTGHFEDEQLLNFDETILEDTGFNLDELRGGKEIIEDEVPEPPIEPKAKLGDLYQLGNHRLLCGDATKKEDVERLMDGKKADIVFTDPPYGVSYGDKNAFLNSISRGNKIQTPIKHDHDTVPDMKILWDGFLLSAAEATTNKASYYVCSPQGGELMMMMMMAIDQSPWMLKHTMIWVKNNHVLGRSDYNYKHEPILYGWKKDGTHEFIGGGAQKTSVWEVDKPLSSKLHPTMKPIELMVNAIQNSTTESQIVIDLFGGSGSTLIASEQLNRSCYMMEIDPHYIDVIIARWEKFTNKTAVKI